MLLYQQDPEPAGEIEMATKAMKKRYVKERHKWAISQMVNASGYKKGMWKTYIAVDGKRKEILREHESEIYDYLFNHYYEKENVPETMKDVCMLLAEHKKAHLGRAVQTVNEDIRRFQMLSPKLQNKPIFAVTDEDIQEWLVKFFLPTHPKESSLRKQFQLLSQIFEYGIRKKCCTDNPMKYLSISDYTWGCDLSKKKKEDREFSEEEIEKIREEAVKTPKNPRSLMVLVSIETGLRAGELAALHKDDIEGAYLHVHRQQRKEPDENGHERVYEVPYTKDERMHPHDGRMVPITKACREALDLALELPGDSEYLFHDNDSEMINKVSYNRYLFRLCRRLGIKATNNHAFRIAFNSRMIDLGFNSAERALILGHEVQTNELHYSVTDKRRLEKLKNMLV